MSDIICYIFIGLIILLAIFLLGYCVATHQSTQKIMEEIKCAYSCDYCVHHGQNPHRCKTCKRGALDRYQTAPQFLMEHRKNIQE